MITANCVSCGAGPMDLPGSQICEDCQAEGDEAEAAYAEDLYGITDQHDYDHETIPYYSHNGEDY